MPEWAGLAHNETYPCHCRRTTGRADLEGNHVADVPEPADAGEPKWLSRTKKTGPYAVAVVIGALIAELGNLADLEWEHRSGCHQQPQQITKHLQLRHLLSDHQSADMSQGLDVADLGAAEIE
jgi:hypothetical protein